MARKHTTLAIEGGRARRAAEFLRRNWPELEASDPDCFRDMLESESGDFMAMVEQALQNADDLRAIAEARKIRGEELISSAKALEAKADVIEERVQQALEDIGVPSLPLAGYQLSIPEKGPDKVIVTEPALLPEPYWRQPEPPAPKPDLRRIAEVLKTGTAEERAELARAAVLSNSAPKMRIKRHKS